MAETPSLSNLSATELFELRQELYEKMHTAFTVEFEPQLQDYYDIFWDCPFIEEAQWEALISDDELEEYFENQFASSIMHAYVLKSGLFFWQHCLETLSEEFTPLELAYLSNWNDATFSFFTVTDISEDKHEVELEDLFNGQRYVVLDEELGEFSEIGELLGLMVVPISDSQYTLEPLMMTPVIGEEQEVLRSLLEQEFDMLSLDEGQTVQEFLKKNSIFYYWLEMVLFSNRQQFKEEGK